jgi:hypothetical protein
MGNANRRLLQLLNRVKESSDPFGKLIADGTRNSVDIPSMYRFNPERLRLYENDARVTPAAAGAQFVDAEGEFRLEPDAGTKLELQTAERPRYIVGYEAQGSLAARLNSTLGTGDTAEFGLRDKSDPENKAFFEFTGDGGGRAVIQREGSEVASTPITLPDSVSVQDPIRYAIDFNWYGVGSFVFTVSYTDDSELLGERQQNATVAELTVDDGLSTADAAFHVYHELDAATAGQSLTAGSYGYLVKGNVDETTRTKAARLTGLSYGGSGEYEAVAAVRIPDDRGNVYCQFKNVTVFPSSTSGELLVVVVSANETDASGFVVPPQQSDANSVVRQTESVTTFPDADGNLVTSDPNPNGYQVGFTRYESAGSGNSRRVAPGETIENKRPLYEDDVAIFLYKADSATADDLNLTYYVEQDW